MITVILATHNGASTLPRTLEALCAVAPPDEPMEIIAVDNASTDRSAAILEDYLGRLPLRVLSEPRQGKSFALNRAIDAAGGHLLLFLDDDTIPDPDWARAYVRAASENPDCGIFAGQVRHEWEAEPPGWLRHLAANGMSYAGTPISRPEGEIPAQGFKGCNMMARRSALGTVRFPEAGAMNYSGTTRSAGGEDTLFAMHVIEQGFGGWYVPGASIRHIVRKAQVGLRPVFQRYYRIGRSMAATGAAGDVQGRHILGFRTRPLGQAGWAALSGLKKIVFGDVNGAALRMVEFAMSIGQAVEGRRLERGRMPVRQGSVG